MSDQRWPRGVEDPEGAGPSAAEIGELVAGAGPRAGMPEEDFRRIREAAREEWRRRHAGTVGRRSSATGRLALAAGLLVAVALGWQLARRTPVPPPAAIARVEVAQGAVRPAGLAPGRQLFAGSRIETVAAGAVALRLADGAALRLDAGTVVRLESASRVRLDRGAVYVDSDGARAEGIVVATALGDVREIGTRFEVRLAPEDGVALAVSVREGRVAVEGIREIAAGERLELGDDGAATTTPLAVDDPAWSWIAAAAAALDIEGRRLGEVIGDYVRATGRSVRFADAALEAEAAEVVLHGSVEGLAPEEALEAAVAGAGLRLARDGRALVVERSGREP